METRILIADNDEKSLAGLGTLLADLQYATALARTLDDAVESAARFAPDVAIVALSLAANDDFAALVQRLREACATPRMPLLIALGGWGESQHRDAAIAAGFDVHLVRPVGLDQLTFILSMIGG
ncbi:Response regulatory domain-containing protein [Paraburkholderia tropica]|uniref:response regulator n=1 Tax=Paraburkholderia TaxID=1822464 RepID=UPI001CB496D3|nr:MULTISPECIES: response regulator [Paraburkholderia]CAG9235446.1 Response regulatory domain-containing protein [Paraburkholderia tropica]